MARLDVYYESALVGHVRRGAIGLEFEYAREWLNSETAFPISVSLPLGAGAHSSSFFSNLLPEGPFREVITRRLRIPYQDDFALLECIGGECAGALSLLSQDTAPEQPEARVEELSLADLEDLVLSGAYADLSKTSRSARLSLAGAQGKLPVVREDDRFFLPLGNTPSTHLLKFENAAFRHLPHNEVMTTGLFSELGLKCVTATLHRFGTGSRLKRVCCVTRYDRLRDANGTVRLHQEDLCQALGLTSHEKYEADGGPSFARMYRCVQQHSKEPFVDARALIDWWLLCWLCGNSDAHAKNLALLYHEGSGGSRAPRLAPFYDLVCTRAYDQLDYRLATRLGGETEPGQAGRKHLLAAAAELGVRGAFLVERTRELARKVPGAVERVVARQRELYGPSPAHERVAKVAKTQARRALTLIDGT